MLPIIPRSLTGKYFIVKYCPFQISWVSMSYSSIEYSVDLLKYRVLYFPIQLSRTFLSSSIEYFIVSLNYFVVLHKYRVLCRHKILIVLSLLWTLRHICRVWFFIMDCGAPKYIFFHGNCEPTNREMNIFMRLKRTPANTSSPPAVDCTDKKKLW